MSERKYVDRELVELKLPKTADFDEHSFESFVEYVSDCEELNPSFRIIDTAKDMMLKAKRIGVKEPAVRILNIDTFIAEADNSPYPNVVRVRLEVTGKKKANKTRTKRLKQAIDDVQENQAGAA